MSQALVKPGAVLHGLCGKMAAGKSTLARRLVEETGAVLICEDLWLQRLYPADIATFDDYLRCAGRLQRVVGPHVEQLLQLGVPVVLDFPANNRAARAWQLDRANRAGGSYVLHFVDTPNERCLEQLHKRNREQPEGSMVMSDADFVAITRLFEPPGEAEGLQVRVYGR